MSVTEKTTEKTTVTDQEAEQAARIIYRARWDGTGIQWPECETKEFWVEAGRAVLVAERAGQIKPKEKK